MQLDLYGFDKWLRANKSNQTRKDYMSKMEALKRRGITEQTAPSAIFRTVVEMCEDSISNSKGRMFANAIQSYQEFRRDANGDRIHLIDNPNRIRYRETFPREYKINPPKKGLRLYKTCISRCKDDAMKLAMMLELNGGLRIGEATSITPEDVIMAKNTKGEDTIWLNIDPHKTEYGRRVRILREDGLFDADEIYELMGRQLAKGLKMPNKIELTKYFMGMDATSDDPGGESHDLRKYCARGLYRGERLRGKNKRDASETVRKQLGHRKKEYTIGEIKGDGGYVGKVYLEDKGGKYRDDKIDWRTP